jgi:hypothetical protein
MAKLEDGEFELVLGNKQLLSVFFIVAVLFAVFFAMGYIAGRNATPADLRAQTPSPATASTPAPPGAAAPKPNTDLSAPPTSSFDTSAIARSAGPEPAGGQAERTSAVVSEPTRPAQPTVTPRKEPEAAKPAPTPVVTSTPVQPAPAAGASSAMAEPQAGQVYLQVAAIRKADAEYMAGTVLKGKLNLPALVAPVPGQDLYRVLVGPCNSKAEQARMQNALQDAGFKPIVRKF